MMKSSFRALPLLALASCATSQPEPTSTSSQSESPSEVRLLTVPGQSPVMQARLAGDLDLRSGCPSIVRGSGRVTLVWAGDAREEGGAVIFQGRSLGHGERTNFGGGFVEPSAYPGLRARASELGCASPFFLVQTVER